MQEILKLELDLTRMFDSDKRVAMALLEHIRTNKEEMLEKEKKVMRLADKNGQDRSQYKHDCKYGGAEYWDSQPKPFDEYYKETFNK